MAEANFALILSNPVSRYPRIAPELAQKPKLLDRLREALRSRSNSATFLRDILRRKSLQPPFG